jgi:uncharacterized membrane protein (DUF485 family)
MDKKICIMCGKEKSGLDVKEDHVIWAMRWIKRNITRNPKNYKMVVCKEDFLAYKKKRDSYERKQIIYLIIGFLFLVLLVSFARGRIFGAIFYGVLVMAFMYLLSLISYIPAVDMPDVKKKEKGILK